MNYNSVKSYWDERYKHFNPYEKVDGNLFFANKDINLKNKKILIIAVGTGKEVIKAARAGADVYGIDISTNAVKNANDMLAVNNLNGKIVEGDASKTNFDSNFFDIVWGCSVLHHLDHEKFSKELHRILKKDGQGFFVDEPTFFNPLIKFAYETLFGKGRNNRRRKVLFFTRRGDDFEKPIDDKDIAEYNNFELIEKLPHNFMMIEKISHSIFGWNDNIHKIFRIFDKLLIKLLPALDKFGYEYNFIFKK